jgi:type I restriction enzyme S subunit
MSVSIVKYSDFCEEMRFDAEYYKQEYLNTERKVEKNSHCTILNTVAKKSKKKFNPLPNPTGEFNYIEIENINLSNGKYDYSTLKNYEAPSRARKLLDYEDVLISTVRPNRNAIAIFLHKGNNFVCSTGFAVIKSHKINPFYLFVFLKTSSSINQLVRKTSAAMYPAVSEDDIMSMKVILPDEKIQKGIELKIKLALNKEKQSDDKFNKAEQKLLEILGIKKLRIPDKKTNIISFSDYRKTLRLDSRFYLLKYENAIEAIKNSGYKIKTVSEIISEPLKSGATPLAGTNAYIGKEKGIPFYRIVDIKNFELAKEKILYIRPDIHNGALKRSKIKYGDILFSIAGTIGICVVVPETLKEGNINQALAIIRLKKEYNPYFIALFFNSYIGRLISEKISRPVVQANLNLSELATLPIPQIPENIQNKIANLVREALQFRQESRNLIKESIKQVENIV